MSHVTHMYELCHTSDLDVLVQVKESCHTSV